MIYKQPLLYMGNETSLVCFHLVLLLTNIYSVSKFSHLHPSVCVDMQNTM